MKVVKNLLCFICIVVAVIFLNNTKCFAAEVQYTEDVIPKMTSDTSPEGKASASSNWRSDFSEWRAFDDSTDTHSWATTANEIAGWLEYDFTTAKCITKYTLLQRISGYENEMPKDWTFEAWDEQLRTWIILDTQANVTDWTTKNMFIIENNKYYKKYRINITANCGFNQFTVIGDMEMMETLSVVPETSKLKVVLEPKEQLQLSVEEDLTENTKMTWTSSDSTVATVDANGVVTAIKPGNTVITSKNQDGTYEESINVLVVEDAKEYRLAVDLKTGQSCRLTIDDYTFTKPVTWSIMDSTIATISNKGKVTAVSDGLTMATATDEQGELVGQIYIRVRK